MGTTPEIRGRRRKRILYLVGLALLVFAGLSLISIVLRAPPRSGRVDLAGQQVSVTIEMAPDPPKTGPIPVQVSVFDNQGGPALLDHVAVRYGVAEQPPAEAAATPVAPGVYRTEIEFTNVGKGWIEISIRRGTARAQLRFPADVRPNI